MPEVFPTRIPIIALYVFIIFPLTALLFLSKLPQEINWQIIHAAKWVAIYTIVEAMASKFNRIEYINKWNLLYSLIFNIILFSGLILHHKKPFTAYIIFLTVTIIGVWGFKIPI